MPKIVVIGSANADLVATVDDLPRPGETIPGTDFCVLPGGKGANQAVAAARLGGDVRFVGCWGDDDHRALLAASLQDAGVDIASCLTVSEHTGVALILVDRRGQNEIVVVPGANAKLGPDTAAREARDADVVVFQLEIPVESVAAGLRSATGHTILDPAPACALPNTFPWGKIGVLTPNENEALTLTGRADIKTAAETLLERGVRHVVVTLGENGCLHASAHGMIRILSPQVQAVDTTAAGDAFNGALAVALAEGLSIQQALPRACAAGALASTKAGAQPSMPTRTQLEAFLQLKA